MIQAYKQFEKIKRNARSTVPIERILPYLKNNNNDSNRDSDSSGSSDNDVVSKKRPDETLSVRGATRNNKENSALFRKKPNSNRGENEESQMNKNSDGQSEVSDGRRSEF